MFEYCALRGSQERLVATKLVHQNLPWHYNYTPCCSSARRTKKSKRFVGFFKPREEALAVNCLSWFLSGQSLHNKTHLFYRLQQWLALLRFFCIKSIVSTTYNLLSQALVFFTTLHQWQQREHRHLISWRCWKASSMVQGNSTAVSHQTVNKFNLTRFKEMPCIVLLMCLWSPRGRSAIIRSKLLSSWTPQLRLNANLLHQKYFRVRVHKNCVLRSKHR